jgi:polysaccharide biosynthesis protein PelF
MRDDGTIADVCLILEGAYPFVTGGVSSWMHELIKSQADLSFVIVALTADAKPREPRYELPPNVTNLIVVPLQDAITAMPQGRAVDDLIEAIEPPLTRFMAEGRLADLALLLKAFDDHPGIASKTSLLNSPSAFAMIQRMYKVAVPGSSFLNFFWTWRALLGGLFSALLAPLPEARIHHAISTGYAGLVLARAVIETGRPGLLTEHGIYTNERRQEIAMADWLKDDLPETFGLGDRRKDLRDVWIDAFRSYSNVCYEACTTITTLYSGNQTLQLRDGADASRLSIIPNGINYPELAAIDRTSDAETPTVALIGRVVPIKDVKTFIRAAAKLKAMVPSVRCLLLGPMDEDPQYFAECSTLVEQLELGAAFQFTGKVRLSDYLGQIDVVVLTSISEAQPLVLLEAGAAGIPSVATDVGSCKDIIFGRDDESPRLGPGGFIVPLADPEAMAQAVAKLLIDPQLRESCGRAMQRRTERYYNKAVVDALYRRLYDDHLALPPAPGDVHWRG